MRPEPSAIEWLIPWHPIHGATPEEGITRELRREVGHHHVLHGVEVKPVGRRQDCDDVLFELLDGTGRFAVVHLTYAKRPEPDPRWPSTEVFSSWAAFRSERMEPDAAEWGTE